MSICERVLSTQIILRSDVGLNFKCLEALSRSFFQVEDRGVVAGAAAVGTAQHGVGDFAKAFTAPANYLDLLLKAKKLFDNFAVQFERVGLVGQQDFGYRAGLAKVGLPGRRVGIPFNQAASLDVAPAMKVGVIVFALFSGRSFHKSYILSLNYESEKQVNMGWTRIKI